MKQLTINIQGQGFSFNCPIDDARLIVTPSGEVEFEGKYFSVYGKKVSKINIYLANSPIGKEIFVTIYDDLHAKTKIESDDNGWTWEEKADRWEMHDIARRRVARYYKVNRGRNLELDNYYSKCFGD